MAILDLEYGKECLREVGESSAEQRLEMEMLLQNSSYGHEYAMMEMQGSLDILEQEALTLRLEEHREAYFQARKYLEKNCPLRLEAIERELLERKMGNSKFYNA